MSLKKIIKYFVGKFGYQIRRIDQKPISINTINNEFTMFNALERFCKRGVIINTVIDVGASDGSWSKECMEYFPDVNYLLIEAQEAHEGGLKKFKNENLNVDYVLAAAGKKQGKIYFDASDLFGGLASDTNLNKNYIEVPMISLDDEIKNRRLKPPYILKLDTHGFEIPILEGAKNILKNAALVIIESYNFKLTKDSLKYYEMCSYMEVLGFSPIEIVDLMLREYDNSFWQMDTFFIPTSSELFLYNSYK